MCSSGDSRNVCPYSASQPGSRVPDSQAATLNMLFMCRSDKDLQQAAQTLEEAVSTAATSAFNSATGAGSFLGARCSSQNHENIVS